MLILRQAKNIRDRALEMVRRDSTEPVAKATKRPKYCKEKSQCGLGVSPSGATGVSPRPLDKGGEPGNPTNRDIKTAMS
ncbi:hypothetical protein MiSe_10880 [Microseira wollei NIES-4236]|uniref:Transposase n=1 Tax=Microseira wollei NIES-4236 TaxID=2530354 RepID=A0AAV3X8E9_9CYAN|nr:hypothetical protein MiSe_10880 [Microseira wollei NIES-4236]